MADRVLVTGGAGFIGSHIVDRYIEGGYDVTILDDLSSGRRQNIPESATFVEGCVTDEASRDLIASGGFAIVNHHAAQIDVRVSVSDPLKDQRINIGGLINVLEGARIGRVGRIVFASSGGAMYKDTDQLPNTESATKLPLSPYGVSKLSSEYYLACYRQLFGLPTVALRYSNVYGPRQSPDGEAGVVSIFGNRLTANAPITIFGDGTQTRDYVFVGDVAAANFLASTSELPEPGDIDEMAFNVGTGVETTVNELAQALLDVSGVEVPIQHQDARAGEMQRSSVDPTKLRTRWGWSAQMSIENGLKITYDWVASQQ